MIGEARIVLALALLGACVLWCVARGVRAFRALPERSLGYRLFAAALPLALLSVVVALVGVIMEVPFRDWSGARLAWSAGLWYGYGLYSGPTSGPVLSSLYGPVSPLLFAPALLTGEITSAMLAGCTINVLCCVLPLWFLCRHGRTGDADSKRIARAAFVFCVASLLVLPSTRNFTQNIHVDGAAVGLGLVACVLLFGPAAPSNGRLTAAAVFTALAVWTKHVELTLGAAQACWLGLVFGRAVLLRFVLRLAVVGLGLGAVFVALFGFEGMWFHMFTILRSQPFDGGFRRITLELAQYCAPFALLIALALLGMPREGRSAWWRHDWFLLVLVAAVLFPTSVLARAKVGGWINSYHTNYFMLAAAAAALLRWIDLGGPRTGLGRLGVAALFCAAVAALWCPVHGLRGYRRLPEIEDNPQRQVYDFVRAHPGEAWFAWHPLAMLMAEGRLYHFYWGMVDRALSGHEMSDEHRWAHLPEHLRWVIHKKVASPRDASVVYLPRVMPEFTRPIELPELPSWTVLTR
jgi:hypothetical protein